MTVVNFLCRREKSMMKKKAKTIAVSVAIISLLIIPLSNQGTPEPLVPKVCPVSVPLTIKDNTLPPENKALVREENAKISTQSPHTQIETNFEPPNPADTTKFLTEINTQRDSPVPTPATSKNTVTATAWEPRMGDTRTVDGQKQVYFLGFGWIDDNDEPNVAIFVDGDGDINKMLGRIPYEHYRTLSDEYTAEQKSLRERMPKAEARMDKLKNSLTNVDRFIEKAKKYTDLTDLTPELLRMFIAKVVVGEKAEKYSRTAPQDIWIHYRDIGMLNDVKEEFDIPSMEEFYGMDDEMLFDDELPAAI